MPCEGARDVPHHRRMRLRWDASPWLLLPVPVLAAPAAALWIAAAAQALGPGRPLDALVTALDTLGGPGPRPLGLLVLLGSPALAFVLAFFGAVGGDVAVADWNIDVRLRLPRPPWRPADLVAAALLVLTTVLVLATLGHLVAG